MNLLMKMKRWWSFCEDDGDDDDGDDDEGALEQESIAVNREEKESWKKQWTKTKLTKREKRAAEIFVQTIEVYPESNSEKANAHHQTELKRLTRRTSISKKVVENSELEL